MEVPSEANVAAYRSWMLDTLPPMLPMRELSVGLLRLPLPPKMSPMDSLTGLGAGELRVRLRHEEVSDLAGEGLALTGISNFAGLAEFDGMVMGLSLGDEVFVVMDPP